MTNNTILLASGVDCGVDFDGVQMDRTDRKEAPACRRILGGNFIPLKLVLIVSGFRDSSHSVRPLFTLFRQRLCL